MGLRGNHKSKAFSPFLIFFQKACRLSLLLDTPANLVKLINLPPKTPRLEDKSSCIQQQPLKTLDVKTTNSSLRMLPNFLPGISHHQLSNRRYEQPIASTLLGIKHWPKVPRMFGVCYCFVFRQTGHIKIAPSCGKAAPKLSTETVVPG